MAERDKIQKKGLRVARCSIVQHRCPHLIHSRSMPTPIPMPVPCCARPSVSQEIDRLGQGAHTHARTPSLLLSRSRTHTSPLLPLAHTLPGIHQHRPAKPPSLIRPPPRQPAGPAHWPSRSAPLPLPSVDIKSPPRAPLSLCLLPPSCLLFIITENPQHPGHPGQPSSATASTHASRPSRYCTSYHILLVLSSFCNQPASQPTNHPPCLTLAAPCP